MVAPTAELCVGVDTCAPRLSASLCGPSCGTTRPHQVPGPWVCPARSPALPNPDLKSTLSSQTYSDEKLAELTDFKGC